MAQEARPRESKSALEPMPNTFAIANGLVYDYYPIKLGERKGDFVRIIKLPPVMQEGFVTFQKKLYEVKLVDFLRSRVNVGKPSLAGNTDTSTTPTTVTAEPVADNTGPTADELRTESTFGVQINQTVDLAWEDQIRTLLHSYDPEEEWIIETAAQPQQSNAGGAV